MFVVVFEVGNTKCLLKNHALSLLGYSIDESTKNDVVVFDNKTEAQKVCDYFKNAEVRERISDEG